MTPVDRLLRLITERYGLVPADHFRNLLSQELSEMSRAKQIQPETLIAIAQNNEEVLQELTGRITIGESYFYRHSEQLKKLIDAIIAKLQVLYDRPSLLVWSSGCSDGQEPYSIAIAMAEQLTPAERDRVRIIASDIDPAAIKRAEEGIYYTWSFRSINDELRKRYFTPLSNGQFVLKDTIRKMVKFTCASVQEHAALLGKGCVDYIFFRNVTIYLDHTTRVDIFRRFRDILCPGGLLFTSPSDQTPPRDTFRLLNDTDAAVFTSIPSETSAAFRSHSQSRERNTVSAAASAKPASRTADIRLRAALSNRDKAAAPLQNEKRKTIDSYVERGQRHLEHDCSEKAVEVFRQVVFSHPMDLLSRFWYAVSLQRNGVPNRSLIQLNNLRATLNEMAPDTLLSDGKTTANELLRATMQLKERIS
jgi:chemotaxis methyl-accepting protein methylase